jgi:parallel beta-helix repeat protein
MRFSNDDNSTIANNTIRFRTNGIQISTNNDRTKITGNTIILDWSIQTSGVNDHLIFEAGILIWRSTNLVIDNNAFTDSNIAFNYQGSSNDYRYISHGAISFNGNTQNGKTIHALYDQDAFDVSSLGDYGQLLIFNSTDMDIDTKTLTNGSSGIFLQDCDDIRIFGLTLNDYTLHGIDVRRSSNILFKDSDLTRVARGTTVTQSDMVDILNNTYDTQTNYQGGMFSTGFLGYEWAIRTVRTDNVAVKDNVMIGGITAVTMSGSPSKASENATVTGNTITDSYNGLNFLLFDNITVNDNEMTASEWMINVIEFEFGNIGIRIFDLHDAWITDNTISGYSMGIATGLPSSGAFSARGNKDVDIKGNTMTRSGIIIAPTFYPTNYNWLDGFSDFFDLNITGNTVNGLPIYYYVNRTDLTDADFDDAGQILLINCNDTTISGFNFEDVSVGIYLYHSYGNTITENVFSADYIGIIMHGSFNNDIYMNHFQQNGLGHISASWLRFDDEFDLENKLYNESEKEGNFWWDYEVMYPFADNNGKVWDTPYQLVGVLVGGSSNRIILVDMYPLVSSPLELDPFSLLWWHLLLIILGSVAATALFMQYAVPPLRNALNSRRETEIETGSLPIDDDCGEGQHLDGDSCVSD